MTISTSFGLILRYGVIALLCAGCGREKTLQEKEEANALEAQRLAAERAVLQDKVAAKREQTAADLENRTQSRHTKQAELLDRAATEQIRRESVLIDIRDSIDEIDIAGERASDAGRRYVFSGKVVKDGELFRSSQGFTYSFDRKDGDLFWFSYQDDSLTAKFSRPQRGVSLVYPKQLKELAPGIASGELALAPAAISARETATNYPSQENASIPSSGSVRILQATYGAGNVQRDVKPIILSRNSGGRYSFRADNSEMGGDPIFGQVKILRIKYSLNGRTYEKTWREGESGTLP